MWLYSLVHVFLISFGFIAGSIVWASAADRGSVDQWWWGGVLGLAVGWIVAYLIMQQAIKANPPPKSPKAPIPSKPKAQADPQNPKLIDCPDCGRSVSRRAVACPGCGRPLKPDEESP